MLTDSDLVWLEASVQRTLEGAQARLDFLRKALVSVDPARMPASAWHDLSLEAAEARETEALAAQALTGAEDFEARVGRMIDFVAGMLELRGVPELRDQAARRTAH